jgi:hypothetical protein
LSDTYVIRNKINFENVSLGILANSYVFVNTESGKRHRVNTYLKIIRNVLLEIHPEQILLYGRFSPDKTHIVMDKYTK